MKMLRISRRSQLGRSKFALALMTLTLILGVAAVPASAQTVTYNQTVPATYQADNEVTVVLELTKTAGDGVITALGVSLVIPTGWELVLEAPDPVEGQLCIPDITYVSPNDGPPVFAKAPSPVYLDETAGAEVCNPYVSPIELVWAPNEAAEGENNAPPTFPTSVTLKLKVPADADGDVSIIGTAFYRLDGTEQSTAPATSNLSLATGVRGDADCSGAVNIFDALKIRQLLASLIDSIGCPELADVSGNDTVDIFDALRISQFLAGLVDTL